jgi:hypothetical protein
MSIYTDVLTCPLTYSGVRFTNEPINRFQLMAVYETFDTYARQVIDASDSKGLLSLRLVQVLMDDHDTSIESFVKDGYKGHHRDAAQLLEWMGY